MMIDILKSLCYEVYEQTKLLAGTLEGSRRISLGAGGDISRKIDLVAESSVIDRIKKSGFSPTIIGEECGRIMGLDQDSYLVMDAIDGTTNAIRGIPFYCCSLAYATDYKLSSVSEAAIIDLTNGDLYHAEKGKGAFMNNEQISAVSQRGYISRQSEQDDGLLVGMNLSGASVDMILRLSKIIHNSKHSRHFGANALELCYLARGFTDAYIDVRDKIRPTDMAAGYLIVKESGGNVYSIDGHELDSVLEVTATMSYFAVANDSVFKILTKNLI
jgi:myo-inositol-1(or 4)-monophosphatase